MYILFLICCEIIRQISYITGYTYEELNTFLFLYTQPIILISTGFMAFIKEGKTLLRYIIFIPQFLIFTIIVLRYWTTTAHNACLIAYNDLELLGQITGLGYVLINLFLFIFFFLSVLMFNILCWKVKKL